MTVLFGRLVLLLLLPGCASARFEAALQACDPAAISDPVDALGYARGHEPPPGDLRGGAARNFEAAPPWVVGAARVYPIDPEFRYFELGAGTARDDTPMSCTVRYDRTRRRGLFAADPLTQVELSVVYEVTGKSPRQLVHGPSQLPSVSFLDGATDFEPGDELRLSVVDRDWWSRRGIDTDDALASFVMPYPASGGIVATSGTLWRGTVDASCRHLEPFAVERAFDDALVEIDARLQSFAPHLDPEGWDYGLDASGMAVLRGWLARAASLRGWDAPQVTDATRRMAAAQLCFERAAAPEVARRARWAERLDPVGLRGFRFEGRDYGCETAETGTSTCRLTATVTNATAEARSLDYATYLRVVLAGGREVPLTLERSTLAGQTVEGTQEVPARTAATVVYRLDVPLREGRELARPVMLRDRRRKLFSRENVVKDHPVRLATAVPAAHTAATRSPAPPPRTSS